MSSKYQFSFLLFFPSSLGEFEEQMKECNAFIFYGLEKFFSHLPPFKLAPVNLSGKFSSPEVSREPYIDMMVLCQMKLSQYGDTVRPRLSGHIGTGAYPDKWFGRIWEMCLNTASSVGLNTSYNVFTHCYSIVTNYRSYRMDRQ